MRVAIITETFLPKVDGIVTVICLLLDHLAQRGVEVAVFAPRLGEIDHYGSARVITVPGLRFPFYPDLKLSVPTLTTYRELRDFQPDVVHLVHPSAFGLACYVMVKRMGLPTLVSYHIDYGQLGRHFRWGPFHAGFIDVPIRFLTRQVLNTADDALAPSRAVQQRLVSIGVRKEVDLWRRGVDAERFHPRYASDAMRARLSNGCVEDVLLLYVGRLSYEKQLDHLKPVLERVPGTRLALVGDGPARAALEKHFAGLPVCFMGYLQGETLLQAYASADIFVFPSAIESFGLVVVEAMAAGLPVVASRVGGVGDVVQEGVIGYTFDSGDIDGLVAGVQQIARSRETIKTMGAAARAFAETQTWPAMMDEVIEHYQRLMDARKPSAL
ncbi:MAG: glycosyltransferase family 1 protein [Anaerolineae bacterium]|nr:glycosyltransferase family 1 protein [Anaerolineae bacterium]